MFELLKDERMKGNSSIEQARLVELYLLSVFDEICQTYGLQYWIDYGTLLGAMRHGGFIPWDDDIDVSMPMHDYLKFIKIAKDVLPKSILLQDMAKVPNAKFRYAKLRDRSSFYCEEQTDVRIPCGIFIDVFPAVKMPRLPIKWVNFICWVQYTCARHAGEALGCPRYSVFMKILDCITCAFYRSIKSCFAILYDVLTFVFPSKRWRANKDLAEKFVLEHDDIFPIRRFTFEGHEYNAPNNIISVLEKEYGDWRSLPPPESRFSHATIISPTIPPPVKWARKWTGETLSPIKNRQ